MLENQCGVRIRVGHNGIKWRRRSRRLKDIEVLSEVHGIIDHVYHGLSGW